MSAAANSKIRLGRTSLRFAILGLAAAGIAWVTLMQRGPDRAYLPVMAERAIVLPDGRSVYVQKYEVTVSEWNRCAVEGACELTLRARPDQDPARTPATGLNYLDVQQYVIWINKRSRHSFRLPTAEEWSSMAVAVLPEKPAPLFTDPSLTWASSYQIEGLAPRALKPQGSFSSSPEGVGDLDGSVWEWTNECYDGGSGVTKLDRCPAFFVGGEHIAAMSFLVRDPARGGCAVGVPPAHLGMRLVSDYPVEI